VVEDQLAHPNEMLVDEVHEMVDPARSHIQSGDAKLKSSAEGAYRAFLTYCISRPDMDGWTRAEIVESAGDFVERIGIMKDVPNDE
jgi:hypothetical protein